MSTHSTIQLPLRMRDGSVSSVQLPASRATALQEKVVFDGGKLKLKLSYSAPGESGVSVAKLLVMRDCATICTTLAPQSILPPSALNTPEVQALLNLHEMTPLGSTEFIRYALQEGLTPEDLPKLQASVQAFKAKLETLGLTF